MNNKCQIFTPRPYVSQMLDAIDYKGAQILGKYILENSCGEGNILLEIVKRYIEEAQNFNYSTQEIKDDLSKYILGFEIDQRVREVCIKNLNNEIERYGIKNVKWQIENKDYLKCKINKKIDFIVGNPPYIMYQDLDLIDREFLRGNFLSCSKGKFDYCYAFIEKSIKELSITGEMAYLVPSSIFKNVFGKELRKVIKNSLVKIFDYKERTVFEKALTSPAIICLNNKIKVNTINYYDVDNHEVHLIDKKSLGDKWFFSYKESSEDSTTSKKFGDYFRVSNSVATLLNSVYIINKKDIEEEEEHIIKIKDFTIEKDVLRPAASPRSYSLQREEYIIFPYTYKDGCLKKFEEEEFKLKYPGAYKYLFYYASQLNQRKSDKSAKWFEYGRTQALSHINQEKILISSVITNEVKFYRIAKNTIPYSGFYIIPISGKSLDEAEEIMRSEKFLSYLSIRGINAHGKSLRFSVYDILNYPLNDTTLEKG
ncbi:N-6 DNA methylase [Bacillus velezensis]|uniref:Eco57I restriction-modification methylase domain-containing protein n=1 Tax=Bacillus velezensis TaxID=492670 RepID=UPI0031364DAA